MKTSANQQNHLMLSIDWTKESGRRQSKERKSSTSDQNDYGVCLLRDSPYRILRVSEIL